MSRKKVMIVLCEFLWKMRLGILRHGRPPRQERGILRHEIQRNGRKNLLLWDDNREWPIHNATPTAWIGSIVNEIWCLEVELRLVVHGMGTLRHFLKKKIFELDFFNTCFSSKVDDKNHPRHGFELFPLICRKIFRSCSGGLPCRKIPSLRISNKKPHFSDLLQNLDLATLS